jgi:APA family basic amino acid/polyamine antiporter
MPPGPHRIGFWMAVALVMGNMIGSGIFLLPASLSSYGAIGLLGWIVSAVGSIFLALVFARMSRAHPAAGGPYAFTRMAFGDLAGFLVAWGYWLSICSGNAGIALACIGYLEPLIPQLVREPLIASALAVIAVWIVTLVNIRGIREAAQLQLVTTILKIIPLVLIAGAVFVAFNADHFTVTVSGARAIGGQLSTAAALTFWAFGGLESATIPAGSVANPERTIPRATMIGTVITAVLYIAATVGVMSIVPPDVLKTSTAPFADAARGLFGNWAAGAVAAGAAIACFGCLNGWVLIAGQMPLAIARDGLFPRAFARVSERDSPVLALIVSSTLTTALLALNATRGLVDLFTFMILLGTLSTLVPYAFSSMAAFLIDRRASRRAGVIAMLAFGYSLWMIGGSGPEVVYWGFLLLLCGLPVYVWVRRDRPL